MGKRLTKIYTRSGDKGSTGLADGSRVEKDHPRIEAIGSVDELNSCIGLLRSRIAEAELDKLLLHVQHRLFDIGAELAQPGQTRFNETEVATLEQSLDQYNAELPPLEEFILPAGSEATATCHLARSICRRAERRLHTLARTESVQPPLHAYLNRLSDLLFVVARHLARQEGGAEVQWQPQL